MAEFDASKLTQLEQYKLLVGTVTPRPIALVTTLGPTGPNAAPFSFFNAVGSDPPMLCFSAGNIPRDAIKDKMNVCAVDYAREINELEKAGFTAVPSRIVRPPRIKEAPVAMECKLVQIIELGRRPNHLVIGEVVWFHYDDGLVNDRYHVDVGRVNPIGRLAGKGGYTRITDRFEMPRLPGGSSE